MFVSYLCSNESIIELRKDPGIPNLYPYKEQLLKEFQDRKEDSRQMQQKERLEKQRSLQSLKDHVAKKTEEYDMKVMHRGCDTVHDSSVHVGLHAWPLNVISIL